MVALCRAALRRDMALHAVSTREAFARRRSRIEYEKEIEVRSALLVACPGQMARTHARS